jgi:hypothetical protein
LRGELATLLMIGGLCDIAAQLLLTGLQLFHRLL